MTAAEVLDQLQALGTEQTRRMYRSHGAGENAYGVSYGNLTKLRKAIKVDHDLARAVGDGQSRRPRPGDDDRRPTPGG